MTPLFDYNWTVESLISQGNTYEEVFEIYHRGISEECLKPKRYAEIFRPLENFSSICQLLHKTSYMTEELYQKTITLAETIDVHVVVRTTHFHIAKIFDQLGDLFVHLERPWEASSYFERSAHSYKTILQPFQAACTFEKAARQYTILQKHQRALITLQKAAKCYKNSGDWKARAYVLTKAIERSFVCKEFFLVKKLCEKVHQCYAIHLKEWSLAALFSIQIARQYEEMSFFDSAALNFKKAATCYQLASPPDELEAGKNFANAASLYTHAAKLCENGKLFKLMISNLSEAALCSESSNCLDRSETERLFAKVASSYEDFALHYESKDSLAKAASCWMYAGKIYARKCSNREKKALICLSRGQRLYIHLFFMSSVNREKNPNFASLHDCTKVMVQDMEALPSNCEEDSPLIPEWFFDSDL